MKKLNKLCAILFAMLGVSTLSAQTDVTSTYLTNADFSQGDVATGTYVYGYGKDGSPYGLQEVTGWSSYVIAGDNNEASYPNSGMAGAILAYGSSTALKGNNKSAPTTNPNGGTDGNCLGFMAVWGCGGYYYQNVTLEAGVYTFETKIYNQSGTQDNTSYIGFIAENGTSYVVATNPTVGQWSTQTVSFGITTATKGKIVVGYQSIGGGSGANPHIFIDGITLTYKTFDDVSAENPVDVTSAIVNPSFETGDMTGWSVPKYSSDTKVWPNSNGTYTTSGVDGSYLFNTWWQGVPITQTVANLPNGKYTLNVLLASDNGASLYLLANDEHSTVQTITGDNKTFVDASFDFKVLNGQATIGVVGGEDGGAYTANGYWWYKADNFRLTYKGADISLELEALAVNLETAKAVDKTVIPSAMGSILDDAIAAAEEVEQALNPVKTANNNLIAAINLANEAVAPYASLKELIALCTDYTENSNANSTDVLTTFQTAISTATADGDAATTVDAINTAYNTLESARRTYAQNAVPVYPYPFDMTFLLPNTTFDSNTDGWTKTGGANWMSAGKNVECYNTTFEFSMEYEGLNSGSWEIQVDAFYRYGGYNDAEAAHNNGTEQLHATLYANNNTVAVKSIMEGANKAGSVGATTTNGVRVPNAPADCDAYFATGCYANSIATVIADGKLKVGIKKETTQNADWTIFDNFKLFYKGIDVTDLQTALSDLVEKADAIKETKMGTTELTALTNALAGADAESTNADELETMISALQSAYDNAVTSVDTYSKVPAYIAKANNIDESIAASYQTAYENGTIEGDAEQVRQELNVATANYVATNFKNEIALTEWSAASNAMWSTSGEHWDGTTGEGCTTYYDANGTNTTHTLSKTVDLIPGTYVFRGAGRSNTNTELSLSIDIEGIEPVVFNAKGNTGYGIATDGTATFDPEAQYARNDQGQGWEWEFIKFTLTENTTVTLTATCKTTGWGWASFANNGLWMDDDTYVAANTGALTAPLAEAKALVGTKPMGTEEDAALAEAIAQAEGTISTPTELNTAVDALKEAVANANVWRETYYAEKDKLVAALERFEADYNDAENGALDHMAKSRWETVITKAQAAAVAKDDLTSHEVLTTATTELTAALDAATVSVNEYAALDEAIKAATALAAVELNWGDQPFQRPESAKAGLDTTDEQAVYDAAEADGEGVTSVTEALNAAMDITLNVPEGDFYLTVATEGHKYLNKIVFASLGATGDNNPTGYVFNTTGITADTHKFTFEQVEGNLYRISVEVGGEKVYLTTGSLNGSAAGWNLSQIQGTTDAEKAATFKIEASPAVEGAFRIYNTEANAYVDCQDGGNIYTDTDIQNEDFAIVDEYLVSTDINISAENKVSTCVLMFDAEIPEELTVYVGEEHAGDYMIFKVFEGTTLPAYTPCLLYAENGYEGTWEGEIVLDKYEATVTGEDGVYYGAIEDQTISAGYVLQKKDTEEVAKFYNINGREGTIPAGKCWLNVTTTTDAATVTCLFRGGIANNIDEVMVDKTTPDGAIYTLDGKRVSRMERGKIYIINGQKIMVK